MKPITTNDLFDVLGDVIKERKNGTMPAQKATSIIEAAKVMTSILNYELKNAKLKQDLGYKDVVINDVTKVK